LGVGTDLGGSVRIPAAFCGIYSFRPSYDRLPSQGVVTSLEGQDSITSVMGPMANSLSGVKTLVKALLDAKPWSKDPLVHRRPWSEAAYQLEEHGGGAELCFGFMPDNGLVKPQPPLYRAMEMTKKALIAAGHKVIEWEPAGHAELIGVAFSSCFADGGADYRRECSPTGEPWIKSMSLTATHDENDAYQSHPSAVFKELSVAELWELNKTRRGLRKAYLDRWEKTAERTGTGRPIDAIICPAAPYSAPLHGENRDALYTALWNALDYPVAVVPVTTVDPALDVQHATPHEFRSEDDKWVYESYDPSITKGSPVGLQVVGQRQEEEATIAVAEIVDRALKAMAERNSK